MSFGDWLNLLLNAYKDNCVTLRTMRDESVKECDPLRKDDVEARSR